MRRAFTLIELLIVVAIIAILAAIAVPNFLEAQTRAKVSRAKSDLRTITTALEAYVVDTNRYPPNDGRFNVVPVELSTPTAYLSQAGLVDPFSDKERHPVYGEAARYYTYQFLVYSSEVASHVIAGKNPPTEAIDGPLFNQRAITRYGRWKLMSNGPDRVYSEPGIPAGPWNINAGVLLGADIPYDASNGTVSFGNIIRTQQSADGPPPW